MKRSMKTIFTLILCTIGLLGVGMYLRHLDVKHFEGFWWYLVTKPKSQDIVPKYQKYVPLRDILLNIVISVGLFGGIISTLYWNVKIKRKSNRD